MALMIKMKMKSLVVLVMLLVVLLGQSSLTWSYNNGLALKPPMGWNTWCTDDLCGAIDLCTEQEIKSVADGIVAQGLDQLGYTYINLDDCWSSQSRDSQGRLQPAPDQFPSGMKSLADYLHSKGLKLGLYTCVGTLTCKRKRPGSYNNFEIDAQTLADWGVDFVKADFCHHPSNETTQDLYSNFSAALNATGRPILFSLCEWGSSDVISWGAQYGQIFRIQMDHIPFWHFPPDAAGEGFGQGTRDIINFMSTLRPSLHSRPYGWFDPDFLETLFPTLNFVDSRTEFSFWALWSAPLLVATDLRNLTSEKRSIVANPEVIAVNQDITIAGDMVQNNTDGTQVWSKPLENGDQAVLFFNSHDLKNLNISVTWEELGWSSVNSVQVRDLWGQKYVGEFEKSFNVTVAPHDVFFFRASPATWTSHVETEKEELIRED